MSSVVYSDKSESDGGERDPAEIQSEESSPSLIPCEAAAAVDMDDLCVVSSGVLGESDSKIDPADFQSEESSSSFISCEAAATIKYVDMDAPLGFIRLFHNPRNTCSQWYCRICCYFPNAADKIAALKVHLQSHHVKGRDSAVSTAANEYFGSEHFGYSFFLCSLSLPPPFFLRSLYLC